MSLEDKIYPVLKYYERAPQWVRACVGTAYRSIPTSIRLGRVYRHFNSLIEEGYGWSINEWERYQADQLLRTLTQAYESCPYYRESFSTAGVTPSDFRNLEDLQKFPLIGKQTMIDHLDRMASSTIDKSERLYITTGGSTGQPVGFYLHKGISRPKEQAFLEAMWRRAGYVSGDRVAVMRGHVTSARTNGNIAYLDRTRNWLIMSSYDLTEENSLNYVKKLNDFRPKFLHFYPSSALLLAKWMQKTGIRLSFQAEALLCGSERLELPQKRQLEDVFKCRVYRWYGHSERVVLAGEGRASEDFSFWPQYGFAEFGEENEDGLVEVIGTSFHNMAMPLIRYRTGDYVRVSEVPSEYGWACVSQIAGREQEFLVALNGRRISLTAFNMHDNIFDGLYAVQFKQEMPGEARLCYVPNSKFDSSKLSIIKKGIARKLGNDFKITFEKVDETVKTSLGKHRWLVSDLN